MQQFRPRDREVLPALTGLRFYAAALVVISHLRGNFGVPSDFFLSWLPLDNGVSFFFILSGFILAHVYRGLSGLDAWKRFYVARFARIWPAHVTCILLVYLIIGDPTQIGTKDTLAVGLLNIALLHAWVPNQQVFFSYNAVSWSISVEVFFYLLFPLMVIGFYKRAVIWIAGSLVCVAILAVAAMIADVGPYVPGNPAPSLPALMYINPLARLFEFVIGVTAAHLWFLSRTWLSGSTLRTTAIQMLAVALVVLSWSWTYTIAAYDIGSPAISEWLRKAGVTCLPSAFLIFAFAAPNGWIARMVAVRPMIWLGEVSFALYLVHQIPIHAYMLQGGSTLGIPNTLGLAGYLAVALFLAAAVHHGIENPARTWILGRASPRAPRMPTVTAA